MIKHVITNHPNFEIKSFKEYLNGILIKEQHFNDSRSWYENGQLSVECTFLRGQFHGIRTQWDDKGNQTSQDTFIHSLRMNEPTVKDEIQND